MTALPLRDFTAAEQERLDAIEAAPAAEESARERVARAIAEADGVDLDHYLSHMLELPSDYLRNADAAIAVLSGPSSDAEQAVERVQALADEHAECCGGVTTDRLRAAVRGD